MIVATALLALLAMPPTDPRIAYVGRFDRRDSQGPRCEWSASEVRLRVRGTALGVRTQETGRDHWQVVVDGLPTDVIAPKNGMDLSTVVLKPGTVHEVRLVKRTEPSVGRTQFLGFSVTGGSLVRATRRRRLVQVIGDSITCGYGNEGKSKEEHFRPETENAWLSYASIAARKVNADVSIVAWSGRKMWPDNTIPAIYDLDLPTDLTSVHDFRKEAKPDAIVINLATNDFARENPDETGWTGAYEAFIRRLRGHYPKARIYCATGSMMTDSWPPKNQALTSLRGYLKRMVARIHDPKLGIIEFPPQQESDGIGSDWHPSVATHEKMGAQLAARLRKDLRW